MTLAGRKTNQPTLRATAEKNCSRIYCGQDYMFPVNHMKGLLNGAGLEF